MAEPTYFLNLRSSLKEERKAAQKPFSCKFNIIVSFFQVKLKLYYSFTHYLVWMQNFISDSERRIRPEGIWKHRAEENNCN
jgi:hypothetical protein